MKRFRTSILGLLIVVAAFAMAFAALRSALNLWFGAVYTFTVIVLLLTVMLARFQRGDEKAFWFGFALFGWSFFLLGFGPWMNLLADGEGAEELLNPNLLTSKAIFFLVSRFRKKPDDFQDIEKITANTIRIAHLLTTLCLALCGGMIGAMVRRRRGKIVSVKSLSILAALAVITALGSLGFSSNPPVLFFPDLAFDEEKDHSDFVAKWYSKHLRAMGEPSLWRMLAILKIQPFIDCSGFRPSAIPFACGSTGRRAVPRFTQRFWTARADMSQASSLSSGTSYSQKSSG